MFLEISQNSQGNTCARVSFLIKLQAPPATLLKKRLWHRCFPVNFVKFIRTPFFTEHLWWLRQFWENLPINDYYVDLLTDRDQSTCFRFMLSRNFISAASRIILSNSSKTYKMYLVPCIFVFWSGSFLNSLTSTKGYFNFKSPHFFHYFTISWKVQLTKTLLVFFSAFEIFSRGFNFAFWRIYYPILMLTYW